MNLNELEKKLLYSLKKETPYSLKKWFFNKRNNNNIGELNMKQFWDYMEMVEGGNKISERMKSFVRKLVRIANNDEEKKMFENQFKITFKSIPEPSKVITPQDVEWAKNIQKQLKKFNKEDLYDWFEDLPEAMY